MRLPMLIVALVIFPSTVLAKDPPSTAGPEDHTFERAGMPQEVSRWAKPSVSRHEAPGYVGGGRLIHGDGRGPTDGTFATDYVGFGRGLGRVFLGWSHDRSHQAPAGKYTTDGPHVPDPIGARPLRRAILEAKHE